MIAMYPLRQLLQLLALLLLPIIPDAAAGQSSGSGVRLLLPGGFQTRSRPQVGQLDWFGVYAAGPGYELRRTAVTVEDTPFGCGGAGRRITASGPSQPLLLVAGLAALREGRIDTAFTGRRFVYPGESISLNLSDQHWYRLDAFGSAKPGVSGVDFADYELVLRLRSQSQVLATYPHVNVDAPPELLWAGDLDRDGRVDLLADRGGYQYTLFLSSMATANGLVAQAADFATTTC